jgi:hypothetical protein
MFRSSVWCTQTIVFFSIQSLLAQTMQPLIQQGSDRETVSVWVNYDSEKTAINSMILYPNQVTNEVTVLSLENHLVISQPLFIMNHSGQGVALWQSYDESFSNIYMEAVSYSSVRGWSAPQILSTSTESIEATNYNLYLDEAGYVSVFWNALIPGQLTDTTLKTTMHHINDFYK